MSQGQQTRGVLQLANTLREYGVHHVVISPGSRSTPMAWACIQHAELHCHSVINEGSAGFFALGLAQASGDPVALLCTSGTAPAHYFPAVLEAEASRLPLVLLTADRPLELVNTGSNQTTDQRQLYGRHVRHFVDLTVGEVPHTEVRTHLMGALDLGLGTPPGPVHVNLRFRKPLEPSPEPVPRVDATSESTPPNPARPSVGSTSPVSLAQDDDAIDRLYDAWSHARCPMVVVGPVVPTDVSFAAPFLGALRKRGLPCFAESTSQLRPEEHHDHPLLHSFVFGPTELAAQRVDFILQVGAWPVSKPVQRWLITFAGPRWILTEWGTPDPPRNAAGILRLPRSRWAETIVRTPDAKRADDGRGARPLLDGELGRRAEITDQLEPGSEQAAMHALVEALPAGCGLMVGNSLPVRHLDEAHPLPRRHGRVFHQRGLSGIDGFLASLAGAAQQGAPLVGVCGDVTFDHDLGAVPLLVACPPVTLVVMDNGGGRIFDRLPMASDPKLRPMMRYWTTPPRVPFRAIAESYGLTFHETNRPDELARWVAQTTSKTRLVVYRVPGNPP